MSQNREGFRNLSEKKIPLTTNLLQIGQKPGTPVKTRKGCSREGVRYLVKGILYCKLQLHKQFQ